MVSSERETRERRRTSKNKRIVGNVDSVRARDSRVVDGLDGSALNPDHNSNPNRHTHELGAGDVDGHFVPRLDDDSQEEDSQGSLRRGHT